MDVERPASDEGRRPKATLDWCSLVRLRYGVAATLEAMAPECARRGWRLAFATPPAPELVACRLTVASADGDREVVAIGTTAAQALGRAMLEVPHRCPSDP